MSDSEEGDSWGQSAVRAAKEKIALVGAGLLVASGAGLWALVDTIVGNVTDDPSSSVCAVVIADVHTAVEAGVDDPNSLATLKQDGCDLDPSALATDMRDP